MKPDLVGVTNTFPLQWNFCSKDTCVLVWVKHKSGFCDILPSAHYWKVRENEQPFTFLQQNPVTWAVDKEQKWVALITDMFSTNSLFLWRLCSDPWWKFTEDNLKKLRLKFVIWINWKHKQEIVFMIMYNFPHIPSSYTFTLFLM